MRLPEKKQKCPECQKLIEGYTDKQLEYRMSIHRKLSHGKK
jgi:hypothetical protein